MYLLRNDYTIKVILHQTQDFMNIFTFGFCPIGLFATIKILLKEKRETKRNEEGNNKQEISLSVSHDSKITKINFRAFVL